MPHERRKMNREWEEFLFSLANYFLHHILGMCSQKNPPEDEEKEKNMQINNNHNTGNTNFKAGIDTDILFSCKAVDELLKIRSRIPKMDNVYIHSVPGTYDTKITFDHFVYSKDWETVRKDGIFPISTKHEEVTLPMKDKLSSSRLEGENFDRIYIDDDSALGEASIFKKILDAFQRLADKINGVSTTKPSKGE